MSATSAAAAVAKVTASKWCFELVSSGLEGDESTSGWRYGETALEAVLCCVLSRESLAGSHEGCSLSVEMVHSSKRCSCPLDLVFSSTQSLLKLTVHQGTHLLFLSPSANHLPLLSHRGQSWGPYHDISSCCTNCDARC